MFSGLPNTLWTVVFLHFVIFAPNNVLENDISIITVVGVIIIVVEEFCDTKKY